MTEAEREKLDAAQQRIRAFLDALPDPSPGRAVDELRAPDVP